MPVTFRPHPSLLAESISLDGRDVSSPEALLRIAAPKQHALVREIFQASFVDVGSPVRPCANGFVDTLLEAYTQHRALVLRPDDVWLAILVQFNLFVNANAERFRPFFVEHEGKRKLVVMDELHDVYDADYDRLTQAFVQLVGKSVKDPSLCEWAIPDFSTTTQTDRVAGAVLLMSIMKEYFEYIMMFGSGLPLVMLAGEKADWERLLGRLPKLDEFSEETRAWRQLLEPVLTRFVRAFENPDGEDNLDFWRKMAHREDGMSGASYLSGWITAFCVFDNDGKWIGPNLDGRPWYKQPQLSLDGVLYHTINPSRIPRGYADVDVKILSATQGSLDCAMLAGVVGMRVGSTDDQTVSVTGKRDAVAPLVGWWIYRKDDGT
ncbi:hypothetical protein EXIGLDRAFT_843656, partial [Exidia glandulosa HHB12029]